MGRLHVTVGGEAPLTVVCEEEDGLLKTLPVKTYHSFSTSYLCGEEGQVLFELGMDENFQPDDGEDDEDFPWLLQCVRANVQEIEYHNRLNDPLWIRNGARGKTSPRIDPGTSLLFTFCPEPSPPDWQIPSCSEKEQWKEKAFPDFLGMHSVREQEKATIPWDQVSAYTIAEGQIFWFEKGFQWDDYRAFFLGEFDCLCTNGPIRFPPQRLQQMRAFTIAWQGEWVHCSNWRRPMIWMRGRTVTPEQARELIRRTDGFLAEQGTIDDHVEIAMLSSNGLQSGNGWCRPDGRIGLDAISKIKYPDDYEILNSGLELMQAFPFLDLFFLFWECEEEESFTPGKLVMYGMPQPQFGVRFHDKCVEIFAPHDAWEMFCEFQACYGDAPETYADDNVSPEREEWALELRYQELKNACAGKREPWKKEGVV